MLVNRTAGPPTPLPTPRPTPRPKPGPTPVLPYVYFQVPLGQEYSESCTFDPTTNTSTTPAYTVTLDNTRSNVAVGWEFTFFGQKGWASANPSSGTLGPGQVSSFQVIPSACPPPGITSTYQVTLHLSFPQGGSQPDIVLSDTISGPAPYVTFSINPTSAGPEWTCLDGAPPGGSIALSNTGNVATNWSVTARETVPG